jgi:hypothetical protein
MWHDQTTVLTVFGHFAQRKAKLFDEGFRHMLAGILGWTSPVHMLTVCQHVTFEFDELNVAIVVLNRSHCSHMEHMAMCIGQVPMLRGSKSPTVKAFKLETNYNCTQHDTTP